MIRFQFPSWLDRLLPVVAIVIAFGAVYISGIVLIGAAPSTVDVGYQPKQPVPFSHALHAGKLKMDCRYCHTTVEKAAHASVPATSTCIKCHHGTDEKGTSPLTAIHSNSPKLAPVRESYATGLSVDWVKVHDLPDYAYFNHSAHVARGVSCVSCHGRIDKMEEVHQVKELSMSWCLTCHRNPAPNLRPLDKVTQLDWKADDALATGLKIQEQLKIHPNENCSTCHR
jgi:menaquinone reductase, multiheme cytochrome c subunit